MPIASNVSKDLFKYAISLFKAEKYEEALKALNQVCIEMLA
jgi:hypothetical protein